MAGMPIVSRTGRELMTAMSRHDRVGVCAARANHWNIACREMRDREHGLGGAYSSTIDEFCVKSIFIVSNFRAQATSASTFLAPTDQVIELWSYSPTISAHQNASVPIVQIRACHRNALGRNKLISANPTPAIDKHAPQRYILTREGLW
jgi:hypothetical protein